MRKRHGWVAWALIAVGLTGCHGKVFHRHAGYGTDPALVVGDTGEFVSAAEPLSFADRHPLLRKPGEVYHKTCCHKAGKLAAATFIGVPVGAAGEIWQIIKGCPPGF